MFMEAPIGNINFGSTGKALGLPDSVLLAGAGFAQIKAGTSNLSFIMASNGDDLHDQMYIMYGIMLYNEDHWGGYDDEKNYSDNYIYNIKCYFNSITCLVYSDLYYSSFEYRRLSNKQSGNFFNGFAITRWQI